MRLEPSSVHSIVPSFRFTVPSKVSVSSAHSSRKERMPGSDWSDETEQRSRPAAAWKSIGISPSEGRRFSLAVYHTKSRFASVPLWSAFTEAGMAVGSSNDDR